MKLVIEKIKASQISVNFLWMSFDKFITMLSGFAISVLTARHIGPENTGIIQYCISIGLLLIPLSQLGISNLVFDRASSNAVSARMLIFLTSKLRTAIFILLSLVVILIHHDEDIVFIAILSLILISNFFTCIDTLVNYYDSTLSSKVNMKATSVGTLMSQSFRLVLNFVTSNPILFAIPYVINTYIPYRIRVNRLRKEIGGKAYRSSKEKRYNKYLLINGLPLAISSFSVVVYSKINSIMVGSTMNIENVGYFNIAHSLSAMWLFIPLSLVTSILARAFSYKSKSKKIKMIKMSYLLTLSIGIPLYLIVHMFSDEIVFYTYGDQFSPSADIISVLFISTIFSVIGTVSNRTIVNFKGYRFLLGKSVFMGILSVPLSYILVNEFGLYGAAYSLLIIEVISSTFLNYFFKPINIAGVQLTCFINLKDDYA